MSAPISKVKLLHHGKPWSEFTDTSTLRPGMLLSFWNSVAKRVGEAEVERVYPELGIVSFTCNLDCAVTGISTGDYVSEYEVPCTKCRCKKCERK